MTPLEYYLMVQGLLILISSAVYGGFRTYRYLSNKHQDAGKEAAIVELQEHQEFRVGATALIELHRQELDRMSAKIASLEQRVAHLEAVERDYHRALALLDAHGVPHTLNLTP